ncbi:MAG TPA: PEP-CTERM sorting domain-containing protein [Chthoniobacterales bacterium]
MKTITTILIGLFWVAVHSAMGQGITLHAGETYTYQFNTLPFKEVQPWWPASRPEAQLWWNAVSLVSGTELEVKMFENLSSDTPLIAHTWIAPAVSGGITLYPPNFPNVWQDLQGAFSMTVLSGSAQITDIEIVSYIPIDAINSMAYRQQFTPVPEPASTALFSMTAIFGFVWSTRRSRVSPSDCVR